MILGNLEAMAPRDRLLAAFVALLWGCNFLAIHFTLEHFPPLLSGALRWLVLAVPTILLVPKPQVRLRWLIGYGLGFGTGQFAFLYIGMATGMPTGLASLVLQSSAPFTVLLGAVVLREHVSRTQLYGIMLAVGGMLVIGWQRAEYAALLPVILTVLGALSWAAGNLCTRKARPDNPLHFALWASVIPPLPLYALSLVFEGPGAQWDALSSLGTVGGLGALGGLAYTALIATIIGSGIWTALIRRNPAGMVAPFSLLVPVVGMSLAFLVLNERPTTISLAASAVVVAGVLLGSRGKRQPVDELPRPERPLVDEWPGVETPVGRG